MAELPPLHGNEFAAFFEAVHGHAPFPWQARLADRLASAAGWPAVLDLPTGSGKTAVIDLALFQLALEAGRGDRRAPLRIVYVVDRRTIVDQAAVRAKKMACAIQGAEDGVLQRMGARLASYGREGRPLLVTTLRGAIARNDDWARSPDQPLVAISTVDQVGSRLLFRGYGVTDRMKPVHAGLLGNDVLYLLDEVHLSEPFRQTLAAIAERYGTWAEVALPRRFAVVEMSATPRGATGDVFALDPATDEANPVLAKRLQASKPATLASSAPRGFVAELEKAVAPLAQSPGATIAVVVNRVATARELSDRLTKSLPRGTSVHLLTGRMRPLDRRSIELALFPRLCSGRVRSEDEPPLVVVATQCIEAGADFDFDALVTECASLDALRQRFGRLNRLGDLDVSPGVIIARTDTLSDDPVYGDALGETWRWLEHTAGADGGTIDFGISALPLPDDLTPLVPRPADAPVMLPAHLDAWVQTSPPPTPDPDVALWLHGPKRGTADVQVVWRVDVSPEQLAAAGDENAARGAADPVLAAVEALPPASGEAMPVPFSAVRRWLAGHPEPEIYDVEGALDDEPEGSRLRSQDRTRPPRYAVAWRGNDSRVIDADGLRPGMTIVVPSSYGGISHGTWSPSSADPVSDLGELAAFEQRGRAILRLHPAVLAGWFGETRHGAPTPVELDHDPDGEDDASRVYAWLAKLEPPA